MPYQEYEAKVKLYLDEVLDNLQREGVIDATAFSIFKKRIKNDIDKETNGDKLRVPFNKMGYQLTKIDNHYIDKRNSIFHGMNIVKKGTTRTSCRTCCISVFFYINSVPFFCSNKQDTADILSIILSFMAAIRNVKQKRTY